MATAPAMQERLGCDIAEIMQMVLGTEDVIVVIEGNSCMTARVKSRGAKRAPPPSAACSTPTMSCVTVYNLLR